MCDPVTSKHSYLSQPIFVTLNLFYLRDNKRLLSIYVWRKLMLKLLFLCLHSLK